LGLNRSDLGIQNYYGHNSNNTSSSYSPVVAIAGNDIASANYSSFRIREDSDILVNKKNDEKGDSKVESISTPVPTKDARENITSISNKNLDMSLADVIPIKDKHTQDYFEIGHSVAAKKRRPRR